MSIYGVQKRCVRRNEIIYRALRRNQIIGPNGTPDTDQTTAAAVAMEEMVREWQNDAGCRCWISDLYNTGALTAGDYTFTHANGESQILDIEAAYLTLSGTNYKLDVITKSEYDALSNPTTQDLPTKVAFYPTDWTLYFWEAADNTYTLYYYGILVDQSFRGETDNYYFPGNWANALSLGLSAVIADEYGLPTRDYYEARSREARFTALNTDIREYGITDLDGNLEEIEEVDFCDDDYDYYGSY